MYSLQNNGLQGESLELYRQLKIRLSEAHLPLIFQLDMSKKYTVTALSNLTV
jgi:hypothetical protein